MAFKSLPPEQRRSYNLNVSLNKHEHFLLKCAAQRRNLTIAATVRRLLEEDNERHHYDLTEPEWARAANANRPK